MGAVLGIAAFGRTQEKLGGANNGGLQSSTPSSFAAPNAPSSGGFGNSGGFNSPAPAFGATPTSSFGNNVPVGFGAAAPATGQVVAGFGGKPAPMQPQQPEI